MRTSPPSIFRILPYTILLLFALVVPAHAWPHRNAMPTTVDVNGISWRISMVDNIRIGDSTTVVGWTDCWTRHISISRESQKPRTTVMHELSHAMVCTKGADGDYYPDNMYYNSTSPEEHQGIYRFSSGWAEMISRNPKLGRWLASAHE